MTDPINPAHYQDRHPGWPLECIEYARQMPYAQGAAFKYAWRAGRKDDPAQEWGKCAWYLRDALDHGLVRRLDDPADLLRIWRAPSAQVRVLALIYCGHLNAALTTIKEINA